MHSSLPHCFLSLIIYLRDYSIRIHVNLPIIAFPPNLFCIQFPSPFLESHLLLSVTHFHII